MITKEKLIETIKGMPDEKFANIDTLLEEIILMDKVEKSLDAEAKGDLLTEEELDKLVDSW
jgi:hypothetical protein